MDDSICDKIVEAFKQLRVGLEPLFEKETNSSLMSAYGASLSFIKTHFGAEWYSPWASIFEASRQLHFEFEDCLVLANAWIRQSIREGSFRAEQWPDQIEDFKLEDLLPRSISSPLESQNLPHKLPINNPQNAPYIAPPPSFAGLDKPFETTQKNLGLYGVAPNAQWVGKLARAGVPTLQLRYKSNNLSEVSEEVEKSLEEIKGTDALLFINDHWEIAHKAKAYGVHLGQEDLQKISAENFVLMQQAGLKLGISTHGYYEMLIAAKFRPSYLALGAVYPTNLKLMKTLPQGVYRLAKYASLMKDYPLVAIGGINASNIREVLSTGVGSVAMVRALLEGENTEQHVARILQTMQIESINRSPSTSINQ